MSKEYQFRYFNNEGGGDCLFLAIEQAVGKIRERGKTVDHVKIRKNVVNFVTKTTFWKSHRSSILHQHMETISLFRKLLEKGIDNLSKEDDEAAKSDYKKYMGRKTIYGTYLELFAAGNIYKFNCVIVQEIPNNEAVVYIEQINSRFSQWKYFRFTGPFDRGHWEHAKLLYKRVVWPPGVYTVISREKNVVTIKTDYKNGRGIKRNHQGKMISKDSQSLKRNFQECIPVPVSDLPYTPLGPSISYSEIGDDQFVLRLDPHSTKEKSAPTGYKMEFQYVKGSGKARVLKNTQSYIIDPNGKSIFIDIHDLYSIYNDSDDYAYFTLFYAKKESFNFM